MYLDVEVTKEWSLMTKKCFILSLPKFQTPYFVLYILQHGPSIYRERNLGMFPQCRAVIFGCWFPLAVKISLGNFSSEERNATKNTKTGLLQEMSREVIPSSSHLTAPPPWLCCCGLCRGASWCTLSHFCPSLDVRDGPGQKKRRDNELYSPLRLRLGPSSLLWCRIRNEERNLLNISCRPEEETLYR